jgi:hypothetical protein
MSHRGRAATGHNAHIQLALLLLLAACGGGGGGGVDSADGAPLLSLPTQVASGATPVAVGCTGGNTNGTLYVNAEVEPFAALHPSDGNHLLAAWQQDRWSNGGSRALVSAVSFDGGTTWQRTLLPMSRCGGATSGSAGDFERVSDPWVDIGPDGTAHVLGLVFSGASLQPGSSSGLAASRSTDGGITWSLPQLIAQDGASFFNDKDTLTADSTDARFVYVVWDRIDSAGHGPAMLARSIDGGMNWEPARPIFTPSSTGVSQTLGNRIVVLAGGIERGTLIDVFNQIDTVNGISTSRVGLVRSADHGLTWSAPIYVAALQSVGARNPEGGAPIRDGADLPTVAAAPDGSLWVAWQDARFSSGAHDAIAISRSTDGGRTWTAPVAINKVASVAAFTPTLVVRADGLVGVMHYDLRNNTPNTATLIADAWLLTSRDGLTWAETHVAGPFDMAEAPNAEGLFLGDYQGLVASGTSFMPVLALSRTDLSNRTDIFAPRLDDLRGALVSPPPVHQARGEVPPLIDAGRLRALHSQAIGTAMELRMPGWRERVQGTAR